MSNTKSPRAFGVLLAVFGAVMSIGGIKLITMGDNAYFLIVGIGILLSGVFISLGKLLGAYTYGVTLAVVVIWSFLEVGLDMGQLLPRIAVPILIGLYIFSNRVRARLA